MPAQHIEVPGRAWHQVHSRLDYGPALAMSPDRALDGLDDLCAGEPEASDVRAGQESQP
jgi:hypothetical protein